MKATNTQRKQRQAYRQQTLSDIFGLLFRYLWGHTAPADSTNPRQPSYADRLRQFQPLTAVCRQWREAALPIFYQSIVCSIRQKKRAGKGAGYEKKTNLPLILGNGSCRRYVQRLVIDLVGDVAPNLPIALLSRSGFDDLEWYEIDRLDITHWHGHMRRPGRYSQDALAQLNAYLLHRLPKLVSINYRSPDDGKYYTEFPLDCLLASRLSQLLEVRVHSGIAPRIGHSAFLPGLTTLRLDCPVLTDASNLPRFFAETLEHLQIGFSSADSLWDRFYACTGTMTVEFSRLQTLDLRYMLPVDSPRRKTMESWAKSLYRECDEEVSAGEDSDEEEDDGDEGHGCVLPNTVRCAFPVLSQLRISRYPYAIGRVLRHFDLRQIPHICLRDVGRGWASLRPEHLCGPAAGSVQVDLAARPGEAGWERWYQRWVNRVFSLDSGVTSLQLSAHLGSTRVSLPDIIGLTELRTLSLGLPLDLGVLPNLLTRLPRLLQLAVHVHLESSWDERNAGIIDGCMLTRLPALNSSLQSLVAYVDSCGEPMASGGKRRIDEHGEPGEIAGSAGRMGNVTPLEIEREMAWIVARVPSLVEFRSEPWTSNAVAQCIGDVLASLDAEHQDQLSHLKRLRFALWTY
ncbi:hypothetical protein GGI15_004808 [Coemansia interrupta]|uniref:Uncharacterized protein n=1 Tax=Coemansia interrupta TaxID=1126814 RepID=A0A9W8H5T3_9FUNG|nr:hypothetical protein GGI15_004808 [Coemansia interrupta]